MIQAMGMFTLEQRRPIRPGTARPVMQTSDIQGATNRAHARAAQTGSPGHAKCTLRTKRVVDPQEPVYKLPTAEPNRWYEGAPATTIDPTRRPRSADTNSVADIPGATKRKPVLFQSPRPPWTMDDYGPEPRPRSATRDIMRVSDITNPAPANPLRRDSRQPTAATNPTRSSELARPQTAAPTTHRRQSSTHAKEFAELAVVPEAPPRPQTADQAGSDSNVVRAALHSLQMDWSFAPHAALGKELMAAAPPHEPASRPQSSSSSARASTPRAAAGGVGAAPAAGAPPAGAGVREPSRPRSAASAREAGRHQARETAAERAAEIMAVHNLPAFR